MTVQIAHEGGYRVYTTEDGIRRRYVGPAWPTPRSAATYADTLEAMPVVSPLRSGLDANTEAAPPVAPVGIQPGPQSRG